MKHIIKLIMVAMALSMVTTGCWRRTGMKLPEPDQHLVVPPAEQGARGVYLA